MPRPLITNSPENLVLVKMTGYFLNLIIEIFLDRMEFLEDEEERWNLYKKKKGIYINLTLSFELQMKNKITMTIYQRVPNICLDYTLWHLNLFAQANHWKCCNIISLEFATQFAEPGAWIETRTHLVKILQIKGQVHITSYMKIYLLFNLFYTCVDWKTVNISVF